MSEVANYVKFNELPKFVRFNIISDVINAVQGGEDEGKDVFHFALECGIELINKYGYDGLNKNFDWHKWCECVEELFENKRFKVIEIADDEDCQLFYSRHGYDLSVVNI